MLSASFERNDYRTVFQARINLTFVVICRKFASNCREANTSFSFPFTLSNLRETLESHSRSTTNRSLQATLPFLSWSFTSVRSYRNHGGSRGDSVWESVWIDVPRRTDAIIAMLIESREASNSFRFRFVPSYKVSSLALCIFFFSSEPGHLIKPTKLAQKLNNLETVPRVCRCLLSPHRIVCELSDSSFCLLWNFRASINKRREDW